MGINLGFILLTVLVTFFLFATKFISSTTNRLDDKQKITEFIFRLNSTIQKSNYFLFQKSNTGYSFVLNDADTILFKKSSIAIKNFYILDEFTNYNIEFLLNDLSTKSINNSGKSNDNFESISSEDIERIDFEFEVKKSIYTTSYFTPDISIRRFKNIEE